MLRTLAVVAHSTEMILCLTDVADGLALACVNWRHKATSGKRGMFPPPNQRCTSHPRPRSPVSRSGGRRDGADGGFWGSRYNALVLPANTSFSALPADAHLAGKRLRCTIQFQRTANSVLTICLSPGAHPALSFFPALQLSVRRRRHLQHIPYS